MEYINVADTAEKWGVTIRQVQRLLSNNRIPQARKFGRSWMIPADEKKPGDSRREKFDSSEKSLLANLADIAAATSSPMPSDDPDSIIEIVGEKRFYLQYESEIAYLRGDFEATKLCYKNIENDDASKLRISSIAIAAAISTGDYLFYLEIEAFLKSIIKSENKKISIFAELMLSTAYTGAFAHNMIPDWLKSGDFTDVLPKAITDAVYKRAKYFQLMGQYDSLLATAETALEFCSDKSGITLHGIYFQVLRVIALYSLSRITEAKYWLSDALAKTLPHGFITPFIESATALGGLLEQLIEQEYPEYYDIAINQWKSTFANWIIFHNRFAKNNITLILSLREYEIALLVAKRTPFKKIAELHHISVSRLKAIVDIIYGKLFVNKRDELVKFIL